MTQSKGSSPAAIPTERGAGGNDAARFVGEQITVIDAEGTRGPAHVTKVWRHGAFDVWPDFDHVTDCGERWREPPDDGWHFFSHQTRDFGLTLVFEPYAPQSATGEG